MRSEDDGFAFPLIDYLLPKDCALDLNDMFNQKIEEYQEAGYSVTKAYLKGLYDGAHRISGYHYQCISKALLAATFAPAKPNKTVGTLAEVFEWQLEYLGYVCAGIFFFMLLYGTYYFDLMPPDKYFSADDKSDDSAALVASLMPMVLLVAYCAFKRREFLPLSSVFVAFIGWIGPMLVFLAYTLMNEFVHGPKEVPDLVAMTVQYGSHFLPILAVLIEVIAQTRCRLRQA
jgi:hypothetical protein